MRTPRISVVVPVFNVEKYIEKSILSIIRQSYKNFELIVVDDGSQDKSIDVAEALLQNQIWIIELYIRRMGGWVMPVIMGLTGVMAIGLYM